MLDSCTIRLPSMWTIPNELAWSDMKSDSSWSLSIIVSNLLRFVSCDEKSGTIVNDVAARFILQTLSLKKNLIEKKENSIVGRRANEHNENKTMVKKIVIWIIYCLLFLLSFSLRLRPTRTRALCFLCSRAFIPLQNNLKGRRDAAKLTARKESDGSVIDSAKDKRKIEQWVTVERN